MRIFYALLIFAGLCHSVSRASQCTSRGKFPGDAEGCRDFTICLIGGITNYTQYQLTCPVGFVYSHFEQQCTNVTGYTCFDSYNCSRVGNFPKPNSEDCRSFVACVEGVSSIAPARLVDCPEDTLFDASKGECVNSTLYNCNQKTTTTTATSINVTEFVNASVILYEFSTNTNILHSGASVSKLAISGIWFLIIFLME